MYENESDRKQCISYLEMKVIPFLLLALIQGWLHAIFSFTTSTQCYQVSAFAPSPVVVRVVHHDFYPRRTIIKSRKLLNSNHNDHHDQLSENEAKTKTLVFIGGGHAHLQAIKAFNHQSRPNHVNVILIDIQPFASYSGMVPGCIAKLYNKEDTQIDLIALSEWAGVQFIQDTATSIDPSSQQISLLKSQSKVSYDIVSIDIGSTSRGMNNIPGVKEYAIPTRPISNLIQRIEEAEETLQHVNMNTGIKVVVVGGGVAGIELALAIRGRWGTLFDTNDFDVTILNSGLGLLPNESDWCRDILYSALKRKNIQTRNNCRVERVDKESICLSDGSSISFTHCVWATGAEAHPISQEFKSKGIDTNDDGWIRVKPTLQSMRYSNIFAAGDCASIESPNFDSPLKAGVYAVRAGPILIENIFKSLSCDCDSLTEYEPQDDFMKLIACGDETAIGFRFGIPLQGKWVWQLKDTIDQMFMDLFRVKNLPVSCDHDSGDTIDTSQYDKRNSRPYPLLPDQGAELLLRTDDEVDFESAWNVIRDMMDDESYKSDVLNATKARSSLGTKLSST